MTHPVWTPPTVTLTPPDRRCLACGMPARYCLDRSLALLDGCCDDCQHPTGGRP